ncbi:MAG: ATP-binding protein [Euryarchaeota archaeon]|nr:ATP-binding protein [Euryarchaeota archaeon]
MEYLGRVIGRSVRHLRFRAFYGMEFQLGEILVIEDEERGRRLLARVIDIEYGADAPGDDWWERTAGNMMQGDGKGGFEMRERERRLFEVGACTPLGFVDGGTFRKPKVLVPHFSKVRRAEEADFAFLTEKMGDIEAGLLRSGDRKVPIRVGISGEAFPHHIGVFATTGMGKSNLMKTLAASAMRCGRYGMLVLDPHGEYFAGAPGCKGLSHVPEAAERMVVFSSRSLPGAHNTIKISAHEIKVEDLLNLQEYSDAQREALHALSAAFGNEWMIQAHTHESEELVEMLHKSFFLESINVIKRRIKRIMDSGKVTRDREVSMTRTVIDALKSAKVVLVDTGSMPEHEELLVSTVLARAVLENYQRVYERPEDFKFLPPALITMEEAQRVLGTSKGTIFSRIAREGRKFKVGLCAISQQPKLIDNQVISQFNTLFILGLADKRDRDILRDASKQDISDLENEIQTLMVGEALVTSPFVPFALPLAVYKFEDYLDEMSASQKGKKQKAGPDKGFY